MKKHGQENVVFVGDNLEVMRSERFSEYAGKIGLIYIDPPYNTLNVKSYNDASASTAWCEMLSERLKAARELMRDDAAIFVSIDDNEFANLRLCSDDVFGRENFVGTMISRQAQRSNAKFINTVHEYILCYAKNKKKLRKFSIKRVEIPEQRRMILDLGAEVLAIFKKDGRKVAERRLKKRISELCDETETTWLRNYSNVSEDGRVFFAMDLSVPGEPRRVSIPEIDLYLEPLKTRGWTTDARFIELARTKRLCFKGNRPYAIHYLEEAEDNVPSVLNFYSRQGTQDLKRLGIQGVFDTPKPVEMLKFLIRATGVKESYVLDFFAGSGSLGQAIYETNSEDKRNNRFILIQIPEEVNPKLRTYERCLELGVEPRIDKILEFRLKKYLELKGRETDFRVVNLSGIEKHYQRKLQSHFVSDQEWRFLGTILQNPA